MVRITSVAYCRKKVKRAEYRGFLAPEEAGRERRGIAAVGARRNRVPCSPLGPLTGQRASQFLKLRGAACDSAAATGDAARL